MTSRRLLRQPKAAAVMASAVAYFVDDLHQVGLGRRKQNKRRHRRQPTARQHPHKPSPLPAERPCRQQQEIGHEEIRQQQHIQIHYRFDRPTSPALALLPLYARPGEKIRER